MNTDKLFGMIAARDGAEMRRAMYGIIDKAQDRPVLQVQATAIALFCMCRALKIDIRRLLMSVERMANDLDGPFTSTFSALEAYARNEIGRRVR